MAVSNLFGSTLRTTSALALLLVSALARLSAGAQASPPLTSGGQPLTLDELLHSPGPTWNSAESRHFVVHMERAVHGITAAQMLDSLEVAWQNAVALLGLSVPDAPHIDVLVTVSRTRFPTLMLPVSKGLTTRLPGGTELIVLVRNDSVRAYTRHEVMHAVSGRAWRSAGPSRVWLSEGLATFADGECHGTRLAVVGRDVLRLDPSLTADDLTKRFVELSQADRARAYVLAGTLVGYLWATRGREGVQRLWLGKDSLSESAIVPGLAGDLTAAWRAYADRTAQNAPGIDTSTFRRAGCG